MTMYLHAGGVTVTLRVTAIGDGEKTFSRLARKFSATVGVWMLRDHYANPVGLQLEADPKTGDWTLYAVTGMRDRQIIAVGKMTHRGISFKAVGSFDTSATEGVGVSEGDL